MYRSDGRLHRRERVTKGVTNRYVYHDPAVGGAGWLVVEVRDGANTVLENYTHGPDLSGAIGGAGGVGGILAVTHTGATNATYFYHYDANGNVVQLTDTNGAVVSTLDYTPFGHVLVSSGLCTPSHQFSTKEYDGAVGVSYYGYRYYSPKLGRWLNRDPLGGASFQIQRGMLSRPLPRIESTLYLFTKNSPTFLVDPFGLEAQSPMDPHYPHENEGKACCCGPKPCSVEFSAVVSGLGLKIKVEPSIKSEGCCSDFHTRAWTCSYGNQQCWEHH